MKLLQSRLLEAGQGDKVKNLIADNILDGTLELTEKGARIVLSLFVLENLDAINEVAVKHISERRGTTEQSTRRSKSGK